MSHQPEDLISPEEEAEIQRDAILGKVTADLDAISQMVDFMREHPRDVEPEMYASIQQALAQYQVWMKQQGIGMPQPDVDI